MCTFLNIIGLTTLELNVIRWHKTLSPSFATQHTPWTQNDINTDVPKETFQNSHNFVWKRILLQKFKCLNKSKIENVNCRLEKPVSRYLCIIYHRFWGKKNELLACDVTRTQVRNTGWIEQNVVERDINSIKIQSSLSVPISIF